MFDRYGITARCNNHRPIRFIWCWINWWLWNLMVVWARPWAVMGQSLSSQSVVTSRSLTSLYSRLKYVLTAVQVYVFVFMFLATSRIKLGLCELLHEIAVKYHWILSILKYFAHKLYHLKDTGDSCYTQGLHSWKVQSSSEACKRGKCTIIAWWRSWKWNYWVKFVRWTRETARTTQWACLQLLLWPWIGHWCFSWDWNKTGCAKMWKTNVYNETCPDFSYSV